MPLREFLQMFGENIESSQPSAPSPTGIASGPERELAELVYENGQFMMQSQAQAPSNRAKKSPQMNDFPWQSHRLHDRPSGDVYLMEDEIEPWLNYAEDDDGFRQDFCGGISGEISGVTGNDPQTHNGFLSLGNDSFNQMLQHSNLVPVHSDANLEVRNATKAACRNGFANSSLPVQGQVSVPPVGFGPPNIDANTTSNRPNATFGNAVEGQASPDDLSNMKTQKQNPVMPGNATSVLNFSYFSRPATNYKAGLEKVDCSTACSFSVEKTGSDKLSAANDSTPLKSSHMRPCSSKSKGIYPHTQPKPISPNVKSKEPVAKQSEESCHAEQSYVHRQDDVIKSLGHGTRQVTDHEKHVEPVMAASSVGSGNSGERASNDQIPNLKRKSRDVDEDESPSEDNEEESVGVKKRSHARGCSSSKRSRAAEVHNLSERRRRDRINEKMRALQELIPNCNKADKASMLDEAIEYLKTLQLQVQMMSMGAGLCMPQMMYPHGLQHMHPAHMPHFSAMAGGMGMGMGYGMGMLDMITGAPRYPMYPVPPIQGGHFRPPAPGPNHQVYGHPGQGIPMPVPRPPPSVPPMGQAPISSAVGLNDSNMRAPAEASIASPALDSGFCPLNDSSHLPRNTVTGTSANQITNQLQTTNKDFEQPVLASSDNQAPNLTATGDASRKGGD